MSFGRSYRSTQSIPSVRVFLGRFYRNFNTFKMPQISTGLSISSGRVFVLRSNKNGYREIPQFSPRVSLSVPPSVPRQSNAAPRMLLLHPHWPRLLFRGSASSIYPLFLYGYSMISGPQRFGYATARRVAFPSLARAFTFRLLVLGTPSRKVEYNHLTNLSRQLPDLDFHRQGTQHYGLRAEHTWTIGYSAGSSVEIFFQKVYIPIGNRGLHSFLI